MRYSGGVACLPFLLCQREQAGSFRLLGSENYFSIGVNSILLYMLPEKPVGISTWRSEDILLASQAGRRALMLSASGLVGDVVPQQLVMLPQNLRARVCILWRKTPSLIHSQCGGYRRRQHTQLYSLLMPLLNGTLTARWFCITYGENTCSAPRYQVNHLGAWVAYHIRVSLPRAFLLTGCSLVRL